jgi:twitching motility protein PilT
MTLKELLNQVIERRASDLHLIPGMPPVVRVDGNLVPLADFPVLTGQTVETMLHDVIDEEQRELFTVNREIDFSVAYGDQARFRVNGYFEKGVPAASFRWIPTKIPAIDSLGLPKLCHEIVNLKQGLILVTGPTGHGKSTSIAAMIDEILRTKAVHVVTIEDPVEFTFNHGKGIVSQREMHGDTHSWATSLRSVLREDPDVVFIGEMRDFETIAATLTVAETGHLVFATLHTNSAAQSIDRVVDVFPEHQQAQIKLQLSNVLEAIISQRLLPQIVSGRVLAYEILLGSPAVRTVIREGKTHQIDNIIQTSSELGMVQLENILAQLVKDGKVDIDTALRYTLRPDNLYRLVNK